MKMPYPEKKIDGFRFNYTNLEPEILLYVVLTHVGQILSLMPSWTGKKLHQI